MAEIMAMFTKILNNTITMNTNQVTLGWISSRITESMPLPPDMMPTRAPESRHTTMAGNTMMAIQRS